MGLTTNVSEKGIAIGIAFLITIVIIFLLVIGYFMTDGFSFMTGIGSSISQMLSEL